MKKDKVVPLRRPSVIARVGGPIDESGATLAVYGNNLDPEKITRMLGVPPTRSFRRGHRVRPHSPPTQHGAWFLQVRGESPDGPEVQLAQLLKQLPRQARIWKELNRKYTVQLRFGLHMTGWNKGFGFTPDLVNRIAKMRVELQFDIYEYGEEEE
jgi:uncharacterized protein DUF4279